MYPIAHRAHSSLRKTTDAPTLWLPKFVDLTVSFSGVNSEDREEYLAQNVSDVSAYGTDLVVV